MSKKYWQSPSLYRPSRRSFLTGLGSSLLLPLWRSSTAFAKPTTSKRIIFFYMPDGVPGVSYDGDPSLWHCSGSEESFQLPELLSELSPFKERMLFFNGVTMDPSGVALQMHIPGALRLLTAANNANHISIDQVLAQGVGANDPWNHIYLGAQSSSRNPEVGEHLSYPLPGISTPAQDDPAAAFCDLFGVSAIDGGACGVDVSRSFRALDSAMVELELFRRSLGGVEAQKLDFHLTSLEQLQQRIVAGPEALMGESCQPPSILSQDYRTWQSQEQSLFPTILRAQIDNMVAAMECGLGRVGIVQCSNHASDLSMHEFSDSELYNPNPSQVITSHIASHYGRPADESNLFFQTFLLQRKWFLRQFIYLLEQLDSRIEVAVDGEGSMLDNSIVVLISEISDGNVHSLSNMPFLVAGGGGGMLRQGKLLSYDNAAHGDLWIALAQAMGANLATFGDDGTEPLPGVLS
jgi:hypothetical protein